MILYIKHISIEGPGLIGEYFKDKSCESRTIDVSCGEDLPLDVKGISAVVVLGGPMNVYEEEKYPWLKKENAFIKKVLNNGTPFLGICLGAQLLAKACDAKVKRASQEEIGFYKVSLTSEGKRDALFSGIKETFDVFEWHGDTFDIPKGGNLIVQGDGCRNQAFRVGKNAYGLQFHLEVTSLMIKEWMREYSNNNKSSCTLADCSKFGDNLKQNTRRICENFSGFTRTRRRGE